MLQKKKKTRSFVATNMSRAASAAAAAITSSSSSCSYCNNNTTEKTRNINISPPHQSLYTQEAKTCQKFLKVDVIITTIEKIHAT